MSPEDDLEARVRRTLIDLGVESLTEKKMFGGIGFMLSGNMACGVHKGWVISRVGAAHYDEALSRPGVKPFDMTGRPMSGWVMVDGAACNDDVDLGYWVSLGVAFARTLPPK